VTRILPALALPFTLSGQFTTKLDPATTQAFEEYLKKAEPAMDWRARFGSAKPGDIQIVSLTKDGPMDVNLGLIHDWAAGTIVPGKTVEQALTLLQSYADYKNIYTPEVRDSRLLGRDGNRFRPLLRIVKKNAIPVVLDTEYDVEYRPLSEGRWAMISKSTKIVEVEGNKELQSGTGHGFLWRLNAYWVIEPRREGVYLECRTISLSRDIPAGLGWMIRPVVSSLPRASLRFTMEATARSIR
jgi:hypothetical protein